MTSDSPSGAKSASSATPESVRTTDVIGVPLAKVLEIFAVAMLCSESPPLICVNHSVPCRLQVLARMMGGKLRPVRPEIVRSACRMMREDAPKYAGAHFTALKRILDREEPESSR